MSPKNGCNNLYYHSFNLPKGKKLFSYLAPLSRRGSVNPSIPTFGKISLTETMIKLIVSWKFNPKPMQESLFSPQTL